MSEYTQESPLKEVPTKAEINKLEIDFNTAVKEKGAGNLETVKILTEWIDAKQQVVDAGSPEHPKELSKVRMNLAMGILFYHSGLMEDAEESLTTASYLLSEFIGSAGENIDSDTADAIKDYDHDIDYYLFMIEKSI